MRMRLQLRMRPHHAGRAFGQGPSLMRFRVRAVICDCKCDGIHRGLASSCDWKCERDRSEFVHIHPDCERIIPVIPLPIRLRKRFS
jgi:hypothetical protein